MTKSLHIHAKNVIFKYLNRISNIRAPVLNYSTGCEIETKCTESLTFYLSSSTRLIDSIKHELSCKILYCKFRNFCVSFIYRKPRENQTLAKWHDNSVVYRYYVKSCSSCENFMSQICLLTLFVKIKFSQKFLNLQYLAKQINNCST